MSAFRALEVPVVMMVAQDLLEQLVHRESKEHAETPEPLDLQ